MKKIMLVSVVLIITVIVNIFLYRGINKRFDNLERHFSDYVLHDVEIRLKKDLLNLSTKTEAIETIDTYGSEEGIDNRKFSWIVKILDKDKFAKEKILKRIEGIVFPGYLLNANVSFDNETWNTRSVQKYKTWHVKSMVKEMEDQVKISVIMEYRKTH